MKKTSILLSGFVFTILGMLVMTSFVISFLFLSFGNNLSWEMFLGIEKYKDILLWLFSHVYYWLWFSNRKYMCWISRKKC